MNTPETLKNSASTPSRASEEDIYCFPAFEFKALGLGNAGVLAGKRLHIHKRVVTGSYRLADGTRRVRWSYWVTYIDARFDAVSMACVPASEVTLIAIAGVITRRAA